MTAKNLEIEKKYLIKKIPKKILPVKGYLIEQAYLSSPDDETIVRIRRKDNKYYKTLKSRGLIKREEHEVEISADDYKTETSKIRGAVINKTRYEIPHQKLIIELDIYHGKLLGLITAEVEFSKLSEAERFAPPDWFGKDVSLDPEYKNSNLAFYGLPQSFGNWQDSETSPFNL